MKLLKIFVIIVLLFECSLAKGQADDALLDKIDFSNTTMIESDFMWQTIAEYLTKVQENTADNKNQIYDLILAADNVMSRSVTSYEMYTAVYQYLISGFAELGNNVLVDYLVRIPYLEYINPDAEQRQKIESIAESFRRVKIGMEAPDIKCVTINKLEFTLSEINNEKTVILFWAYSCPHCRELMRELGELAKNDDDLAIVTVNVSGDLKDVKRLVKKSGLKNQYNFCDGKGWDSPIVEDYAVDMTPSLFLLDKDKIIISKPFDIEELKNDLGL